MRLLSSSPPLAIQNAFDALELPALDLKQWTPLQLLARLGPRQGPDGVGLRQHAGGSHD